IASDLIAPSHLVITPADQTLVSQQIRDSGLRLGSHFQARRIQRTGNQASKRVLIPRNSKLIRGSGDQVIWGSGDALVWGAGDALVWGAGDALVWGAGDALVWGAGDALVWGAGDALVWGAGDALVWGA